MMYKCIIVEDEPNALALLSSYIEKCPFLALSKACFDAFDALEFLKEEKADIIFLDINMPELSGLDLVDLLPKEIIIIFTTAFSRFAVESYNKNAIDYLLKPISFQRFMQAVMKVADKHKLIPPSTTTSAGSPLNYVFLKTGRQIIRLEYDSILYFEADKEYMTAITKKEKVLIYKRMKDLAKELPACFQRIHHSYIVNIHHIQKIADNRVWIGNMELAISETYREAFFANINKNLL